MPGIVRGAARRLAPRLAQADPEAVREALLDVARRSVRELE
ncbi:MAG: hypothetical protein OXH14_03210 [Alphaproteobacteria bacterium]|nr:hypothetical protein [Alphaproteobacteria bacterium]